jgi:hypothetical protein
MKGKEDDTLKRMRYRRRESTEDKNLSSNAMEEGDGERDLTAKRDLPSLSTHSNYMGSERWK